MYDCDNCDWSSGTDSDEQSMPEYRVVDDVQYAHCPGCWNILDERDAFTGPLADRFSAGAN